MKSPSSPDQAPAAETTTRGRACAGGNLYRVEVVVAAVLFLSFAHHRTCRSNSNGAACDPLIRRPFSGGARGVGDGGVGVCWATHRSSGLETTGRT